MTCKDCIHYDVCTFHLTGKENKTCLNFLDKTNVIKVIRCRDCANYFHRGEYDGVEYGDCYYDNIVHPDDYCSMAELRGDSDG